VARGSAASKKFAEPSDDWHPDAGSSRLSPKKRIKQRRLARQQKQLAPAETRTAEAVTVAWMLSTMVTVLAEVVSLVSLALILVFAEEQEMANQAEEQKLAIQQAALPGLILFIGIITGIICLVLAPVVHQVRRVPPPRTVTIFAVAVGLTPMATWLVLKVI
jgi:heme/copper-type cytochrome/quinol oxidase subunit 2